MVTYLRIMCMSACVRVDAVSASASACKLCFCIHTYLVDDKHLRCAPPLSRAAATDTRRELRLAALAEPNAGVLMQRDPANVDGRHAGRSSHVGAARGQNRDQVPKQCLVRENRNQNF